MMNLFKKFKEKKLVERFRHKRAGVTLVELMVTFALLGFFFTAASGVILSGMRLFDRIKSTSNAVTVSDLLLDKITGEITAADLPQVNQEGYYCWISDNNGSDWIVFNNRSGSPIEIYAATGSTVPADETAGQIYIRYYEMSTEQGQAIQEIKWHFDDRVYMGFKVTKLTFSRPDSTDHPNVVRVDLTIRNERTGFTYQTYRFARNYNFDPASNFICQRSDIQSDDPDNKKAPTEASQFKIIHGSGG